MHARINRANSAFHIKYMLNNIKIALKKVRKSLVYLEAILRNAYLCTRFQMKGLEYQNYRVGEACETMFRGEITATRGRPG